MSAFTPASEVLLRHSDDFESARVLFAGDLQDDLPARLDTAASRAHTQQFHHWQVLNRQMGDTVRFSLVAEAADVAECDTLIYYWPKNKPEAQFQLMNLLSLLPVGSDIFVVGENRSGVRSAEQMLAEYAPLNKVDSARRCGLYHGRLEKQPTFDADAFWGEYTLDNLTIKTLRASSAATVWTSAASCCSPPSSRIPKGKCSTSAAARACWPPRWPAIHRKCASPCATSAPRRLKPAARRLPPTAWLAMCLPATSSPRSMVAST